MLLGWTFARQGAKAKPFLASFDALGVTFDFTDSRKLEFTVCNKPGRADDIAKLVSEVLEAGSLSPSAASQLRGRFHFAKRQLFGRTGVFALAGLGRWSRLPGGPRPVTSALAETLRWLVDRLLRAPPRKVFASNAVPPILIFTDGAAEGADFKNVSMGALLIDVSNGECEYWGSAVEPALVLEWQSTGHLQTIGQAELLPLLVSRRHWRQRCHLRKLLLFCDNSAAADGAIRGFSPSAASNDILRHLALEEVESQTFSWMSRVPTLSNPADGPSRGVFDFAEGIKGARRVFPAAVTFSGPGLSQRFEVG